MIAWLLWLGCADPDCSLNDDVVGDGIDQNCDGRDGIDGDGDGQASRESGGIDCDDSDVGILAKAYYLDADQDGWGNDTQEIWLCPDDVEMGLENNMLVQQGGDCDDHNATSYPDATEVCDGVDNDCNSAVDQEDDELDSSTTIRLYQDADDDGWGNLNTSDLRCTLEDGWVLNNRDCDDDDPTNVCMSTQCTFGDCELSLSVDAQSFDFVLIPAGNGIVGSPDFEAAHEPEETQIEIALSTDLYMLTTPVTMAMYATLLDERPSMFHHSPLCSEHLDCPVESVSFHDAARFSNALTLRINEQMNAPERALCYTCATDNTCAPVSDFTTCRGVRLPTESEWETAARAGTEAPFWTQSSDGILNDAHIANEGCGREWTLDNGERLEDYGWFCANNIGDSGDLFYGSKPVALRQPNAFGLFDMIGGIWEMTQDKYIDSRYIPATIPIDPYFPIQDAQTDSIVRKGGMWGDPPSDLRAARREPVSLDYQNGDVGFRVVMRP